MPCTFPMMAAFVVLASSVMNCRAYYYPPPTMRRFLGTTTTVGSRGFANAAAITAVKRRNDSSSSTSSATMYTIDFCPPTDPLQLQRIVTKHVASLNRYLDAKPVAQHTAAAFAELQKQLEGSASPVATADRRRRNIVLDSGCGTGRSSLTLGRLHPGCTVIGVDRSIARLSKNTAAKRQKRRRIDAGRVSGRVDEAILIDDSIGDDDDDDEGGTVLVQQVAGNVWLVRAELTDFWRLLVAHQWSVQQHYLLYPNPYPKRARLKQRWYAHPSFPILWALGAASTTVRSNWEQYLQEFAQAVRYIDSADLVVTVPTRLLPDPNRDQAWTNFEEKYWVVGEPTYEVVVKTGRSV
jgi:tRNA (guanine-N7-)-methyltransferase